MGRPWRDHPSWELVDEASEAAGRDLAWLLLDADADELKLPRNAQLATFVTSAVVLDAVERLGLTPQACAGHSLGEYTALVATGALAFGDGVRVVAERGEAMQGAADDQPGTMAAILGLDDDDVDAACRRADADVWVANYNGPGQVVIAGTADGVAAAGAAARDLGAKKVLPIPVGGAFHTPFMAPARDRLRKALAGVTFKDLEVPVVANVDARPHTDRSEWPSLLSAQLCSPVRWRQTLHRLAGDGVGTFVELGAGGVLTGLVKRTLPQAHGLAVAEPDDLDRLLELLAGPAPAVTTHAGGEHLHMSERLVVSPGAGVFRPVPPSGLAGAEGETVDVGGLVGWVGEQEVRSPFAGWLMGMLAADGERVTAGQPVAWLRAL